MKKFQALKSGLSLVMAVSMLWISPISSLAAEIKTAIVTEGETHQSETGISSSTEIHETSKDSSSTEGKSSLDSKTSTGNNSNTGNNISIDTSNNSNSSNKEKINEKEKSSKDNNEDTSDKDSSKNDSSKKDSSKEDSSINDDNLEEDTKEKDDASEETDCEHKEFQYKSNKDGTHSKICTECQEEITEDCEYDSDGVCKLCGFEEEKEDEEPKTFKVKVHDYTITAEVPAGAFDEDVRFKADMIEELSDEEKSLTNSVTEVEVVADYIAFDLRFVYGDDDTEIEPKDGYSIKISIEADDINTEEIIHIEDEKKAELIETKTVDSAIEFEADSFSTYVVVVPDSVKKDKSKILYEKTAYGSAYTGISYSRINDISNESRAKYNWWRGKNSYSNPRYAFQVMRNVDNYKVLFPYYQDNNYCYIIETTNNNHPDSFKFYFEAPENYYIASIQTYDTNGRIDYEAYQGYQTKVEYDTKLSEALDRNYNGIFVDLQPIPNKLTADTTVVTGATFVNYANYTTAFGNSFVFNNGSSNIKSNTCNYGQVYQDIAARSLSGDQFKLARDNGNPLFPAYETRSNYNYITDYHDNVGVTFNKDTDGYWTIDSSQYKYVYNKNTKTVVTTSGQQFRPFDYDDNHFGMILPINFSINETGTTNGKDTVFKFFGDDDVFVYVDGKLVLDLGGIHNSVNGQINFKTGEIIIDGHSADGSELTSSVDGTCYANKGVGDTNLYNIISENSPAELSKKEHVLTVVYFERGGNLSNCKISFNFTKNETRNVEYKGFKLDEKGNPLAGATFKLFTDEACTNVAQIGIGQEAVTVSDSAGTISFKGLSAGVIPDGANEVSKTYYMKEINAPDGYVTPETALWRLTLTAKKDGTYVSSLVAVNGEAQHLSLDRYKKQVMDANTSTLFIKNEKVRVGKTLNISKFVSDGTGVNPDPSGRYKFIIKKDVEGVQSPLANQTYKVGDQEFTTNEEGYFFLKADETAVFENLYDSKYIVGEVEVKSDSYSLSSYNTRVIIDDDKENVAYYESSFEAAREVIIDFINGYDERGFEIYATDKKVDFINQMTYTLPETGGSGIYLFTISGVLMLIGAALLLYKTKRFI